MKPCRSLKGRAWKSPARDVMMERREEQMRYGYHQMHWSRVLVKGVPCLFNDMRIDRGSVLEGMHLYEVADGDSDGIPARMKPGIMVNFFGTVLCKEAFEPDEGETVWLGEGDWEWLG